MKKITSILANAMVAGAIVMQSTASSAQSGPSHFAAWEQPNYLQVK